MQHSTSSSAAAVSLPQQSLQQVSAILDLAPDLLASFARTNDPEALSNLALQSNTMRYLETMALSAPSPLPQFNTRDVNHKGIPFLLHQRYSPHTTSILAVAESEPAPFTPVYSSVKEWARIEARGLAHQSKPEAVEEIAQQLQAWATKKETLLVRDTINEVKGSAVSLAARAAVETRPFPPAYRMDLSAYKEHYKHELNAHAMGYYPQLHREALRQLLEHKNKDQPSQMQRSDSQEAMLIRASAVAALTANVLAAKDMVNAASDTLTAIGLSPDPNKPRSSSISSADARKTSQQMYEQQLLQEQQLQPVEKSIAAVQPAGAVVQLIQQVEQTSSCTPQGRDVLLQFAHTQYSNNADIDLLPLLHMLDKVHPGHCPTLLLLSCVYYTRGVKCIPGSPEHVQALEASIVMNQRILEIDSEYVEAMSNIGTTLRALGNLSEAEDWWRKAIRLRPTYFDSIENLLGVLCNAGVDPRTQVKAVPRFAEGIQLCDEVEAAIFIGQHRPYSLPKNIPISLIHRIQNMFYAKGNLYTASLKLLESQSEYEKGLETVLNSVKEAPLTLPNGETVQLPPAGLIDLLVATIVIGLVLMSEQHPSSPQGAHLTAILASLGVTNLMEPPVDYFTLARLHRQALLPALNELGNGMIPQILLTPQDVRQIPHLLFVGTKSHLPALAYASSVEPHNTDQFQSTVKQIGQTTSTLLLTLAKLFQDAIAAPQGPLARNLMASGLIPHTCIVLPLYYLAIAFHCSPSTFNNLGILLSTLPASTVVSTAQGLRTMSGQALAMEFYKAGLEYDPKHPHLYTNLGSLLKDMGHLSMAVQMYEKAVEFNPTFDVALANLANAIKDMGHVQDSVKYYQRAVAINPNFPEAVCGLVNALSGICDWRNRGGLPNELGVGPENQLLYPTNAADTTLAMNGWMPRVIQLVTQQLAEGRTFGHQIIALSGGVEAWLRIIAAAYDNALTQQKIAQWKGRLAAFVSGRDVPPTANEGGFVIRLIERLIKHVQRRWYLDVHGKVIRTNQPRAAIIPQVADVQKYARTALPANLPCPPVPTVLPFHTFTYPLTPRQTRLICHRNALRISYQALGQPWLPPHVYPPPAPPSPRLKIGYVSSDFNNHPLAHLMQSVFGMHDLDKFDIFCYATTASDNSEYRMKIEREAQHFVDVSTWSTVQTIKQILADGIHILVNLNGYTKGARNEIFAARPCPVQIQQLMGFAGTLGAGWADWVVADKIIIPPATVSSEIYRQRQQSQQPFSITDFPDSIDPEEAGEELMYSERMAYIPKTYFITDHRQGFRDESQTQKQAISQEEAWKLDEERRWAMRHELFPQISDDTVIFCCLNQLYKIDPFVFKLWLRILKKFPQSVLWLLRFPAPGEDHLRRTASLWAGPDIAARIVFTDVAPKQTHISRGRIADLFLDSTEVGGHTTSADILWSGTPIITFPRHQHKLCSRVAASIAHATGFGQEMVVHSAEEYEARAVEYARSLRYDENKNGSGKLYDLRKQLFMTRDKSPLFDTQQWVRNVEAAYEEMWKRYVEGEDEASPPSITIHE